MMVDRFCGVSDDQITNKNLGKRVYISGYLSGVRKVSSKPMPQALVI
jgi:hypothetical protein